LSDTNAADRREYFPATGGSLLAKLCGLVSIARPLISRVTIVIEQRLSFSPYDNYELANFLTVRQRVASPCHCQCQIRENGGQIYVWNNHVFIE